MKMPEISRQQKQYLARQKKEKNIILAARTLLFVLFMGLWEMSVAIFGSVINLYSGFCQADPEKLKLIETLGGHKKEKLLKIVLPSSVPLILSVMKVNIGLCLVGVIIGEFIGARKGLGYLIIYGSQTFRLTWVLMSIVILCIIAMLLYFALYLIEKQVRKH